jgi:hypothetical protein
MKTSFINILAATVVLATADFCALNQTAWAKDKPDDIKASEYQVKAAFLYNFVKFTNWPENKMAEPNIITIGLLGENRFGNAFDPVKNKSIKDKQLIIKDLGRFRRSFRQDDTGRSEFAEYIEQLRKCHLLFICDSERENYRAIIEAVKDHDVLTVGEAEDFLDAGGIIAFIPETEKPVFEVNLVACEQEKLKISSQVLRLARKIISD